MCIYICVEYTFAYTYTCTYAYTYTQNVYPEAHLTVVDLEEEVVRLALQFFNVRAGTLLDTVISGGCDAHTYFSLPLSLSVSHSHSPQPHPLPLLGGIRRPQYTNVHTYLPPTHTHIHTYTCHKHSLNLSSGISDCCKWVDSLP